MFHSKDIFEFEESPIQNYQRLFEEAKHHPGLNPQLAVLATIGLRGEPSTRVVSTEQVGIDDFAFYTSYDSAKSSELKSNPRACLHFHWPTLGVQIRINGATTRIDRNEASAHFDRLPRLTQLGYWIPKQSEFIESYEELRRHLELCEKRFLDKPVSCPENWGGFRLIPEIFEFCFYMEGYLNYRFLYERSGEHWLRAMKSP